MSKRLLVVCELNKFIIKFSELEIKLRLVNFVIMNFAGSSLDHDDDDEEEENIIIVVIMMVVLYGDDVAGRSLRRCLS